MKKEIWILEDEELSSSLYQKAFSKSYSVRIFSNISQFRDALIALNGKNEPSLLLADLKLGNDNFEDFISQEKNRLLLRMPFIVMSSQDDPKVMEYCMAAGACDYLVKPFNINEITFKVNRVLSLPIPATLPNFSEFGDDHAYTLRERMIIEEFLKNPARTVSRDQISDRLWPNFKIEYKTLDVHFCNLRKKLQNVGLTITAIGSKEWAIKKWDGEETDNQTRSSVDEASLNKVLNGIPQVLRNINREAQNALPLR
ncbi:MAG: response regulator transcription factor [Xanthomonadaceae bacterium]|nr:response regulator transcription factor [Xanthomonadaceae bacterium]